MQRDLGLDEDRVKIEKGTLILTLSLKLLLSIPLLRINDFIDKPYHMVNRPKPTNKIS